jgi:hypothetical protein
LLGHHLVGKWLLEGALETTDLLHTKMVTTVQQVSA